MFYINLTRYEASVKFISESTSLTVEQYYLYSNLLKSFKYLKTIKFYFSSAHSGHGGLLHEDFS